MKKIDKAVEIVRGWSDERLGRFITRRMCPETFGMEKCEECEGSESPNRCKKGWNEEVEQ